MKLKLVHFVKIDLVYMLVHSYYLTCYNVMYINIIVFLFQPISVKILKHDNLNMKLNPQEQKIDIVEKI